MGIIVNIYRADCTANPLRYADDIRQRDKEIERCAAVIARWNEAQREPTSPPKRRHAFLGEPRCVTCGAPYTERQTTECHGQQAPELSDLSAARCEIILLDGAKH